MRLWVQSYTNTAATPSAALSLAAHVALIGAAVLGTGRHTGAAEDELSTRVFYLLPPDRVPRTENNAEHVQYIEIGALAPTVPATSASGAAAGSSARDANGGSGALAVDRKDKAAQSPIESADSVYSVLSAEESAVRTEGSAAPVYPPEMLAKGIEGAVLTRYVIDTTGRADSTSLQVVSATNAAFTQAVREALPGMRFNPAAVRGRKVRQLVEQNFEFHILPPAPAPAEHTRAKPVP